MAASEYSQRFNISPDTFHTVCPYLSPIFQIVFQYVIVSTGGFGWRIEVQRDELMVEAEAIGIKPSPLGTALNEPFEMY